jgi:hypothetical protein
MQLDHLRAEIERMRTQVHRQRGEIRHLQRAGISTASAEALLERMLARQHRLDVCQTQEGARAGKGSGSRRPELGLMAEPLKWYDANAKDNPPWVTALAEVRHLACREGWC